MSLKVKPGASGEGKQDDQNAGGEGGAGDDGSKEKAGAAGQAGSESDDGEKEEGGEADDSDESKWDEKTKAYIAKLRKEAADNRTKAKDLKSKLTSSEEQKKAILKAAGVESDDEAPEEKLKKTQAEAGNLLFRTAILESAIAHGIGANDLDFYQFLVAKEAESLQEDEELSDEKMADIVAKVKKAGASGAGNSSVGNGKGGKGDPNPNPEDKGGVSLDQFCKMNISQKSELYQKNPTLYSELTAEAKQKKRLV